MQSFLEKINKYIQRHNLLNSEGLYIVALSGGADSVALLLALKLLGFKVEAAHCNFNLRGEESKRDEDFCVCLCKEQSIPIHRIHFDTYAYAELHKVSIEMAARDLRYNYFEQLRRDMGAQGICVAHHEDDNVETVLLNIVRGTGLKGLTGMQPQYGFILRPMLGVTRSEIVSYLQYVKQDYVTDSSNLVADVKRNKIRLNLLPMLQEINPSVKENIAAMVRYLREAEIVVEKSMNGYWGRKADIETYLSHPDSLGDSSVLETSARISVANVMEFYSPEYLLFHILRNYGFSGLQVEQICDEMADSQGKCWYSASHELVVDRGFLIVEPKKEETVFRLKLPETGNYVFNESQRIKLKVSDKTEGFKPSKETYSITIDADKLQFPFTLRTVKQGDRFIPFGMKGSKLVSDYLTDIKKNLFEKRKQLVLEDASGTIAWLVGLRTSELCKIDDNTKRIMEITIE